MTEDQQIVNDIATKVMGWHKIPAGQPFRTGVRPLGDDAYFDQNGKYVRAVHEFDPLTDANHTRMVREKMRAKRWMRRTYDHDTDGVFSCVEVIYYKTVGEIQGRSIETDELRAECLAVREAIRKEAEGE